MNAILVCEGAIIYLYTELLGCMLRVVTTLQYMQLIVSGVVTQK